jgi:hypothetical protein
MTEDLRLSIFMNRDKFAPDVKARRIHKLDVIESAINFGVPLAVQLQRDQWAGYPAWDSFSMILQSKALLPSEDDAQRFHKWAMKQLSVEWFTE